MVKGNCADSLNVLGNKVWYFLHFGDVERDCADVVLAMYVNKFFKFLLSPSNSNNFGTLLNEPGSKCLTNARCRA